MKGVVKGPSSSKRSKEGMCSSRSLWSLSDEVIATPAIPAADVVGALKAQRLESTVAVLKDELELISMERDTMKLERDVDIERQRSDLAKLNDKLEKKKKEIAELRDIANAAIEELRVMNRRYEILEDQNVDLSSLADQQEKQLEDAHSALVSMDARIAELDTAAKSAKDELHDMSRRYRILEEENSILHHNKGVTDQRVRESAPKERHEVGSAAETPHEETDCMKERISELEQEKATLSHELEVVSTQLGESFEIFAVHTQDKEALNEKLKTKRKQLEDAQTKGLEMDEELAKMRNRMKELEDENALLKQSAVAGLWSAAGNTSTGGSEKVPQVKRSTRSLEASTACTETSDLGDYEGSNNSLAQIDFVNAAVDYSTSRRQSSNGSVSSGWLKESSKSEISSVWTSEAKDTASQKDLACCAEELHKSAFDFQNSLKGAVTDAREVLQKIEHKETHPRSA